MKNQLQGFLSLLVMIFLANCGGGQGGLENPAAQGNPDSGGSTITLRAQLSSSQFTSSQLSCHYTLLNSQGVPVADDFVIVPPASGEFIVAQVGGVDPQSVALVAVFCETDVILSSLSSKFTSGSSGDSTNETAHFTGVSFSTSETLSLFETCSIFDLCSLSEMVIGRCKVPGSPIKCAEDEITVAFLTVLFPGECLITQPIAEGIQFFCNLGEDTCAGPPATECASNNDCEETEMCDSKSCKCVPKFCGNGECDKDETPANCPGDCKIETNCSDFIDDDQDGIIDCADTDCLNDPGCFNQPVCGDGRCDSGESCYKDCHCNNDVCDPSECELTLCPEACHCGNGIIESGFKEECDDGNLINGDGCSHDCKLSNTCGNGIVESGEFCDPPGSDAGNGNCCTRFCDGGAPCVAPVCGDHLCTGGTIENPVTCSADCNTCGDGLCTGDEVLVPDLCPQDCGLCTQTPVCGNGAKEAGEDCDDGNLYNKDGCDEICHLESVNLCGNGALDPGEFCDPLAHPESTSNPCIPPTICADSRAGPNACQLCVQTR